MEQTHIDAAEKYIEAHLRASGPCTFTSIVRWIYQQHPAITNVHVAADVSRTTVKAMLTAGTIVKYDEDSYDWAYKPYKPYKPSDDSLEYHASFS